MHFFGTKVGHFNFMGNHLLALIGVYNGFKYVKISYMFVYLPTYIILYVTWHCDLNHAISSKKGMKKTNLGLLYFDISFYQIVKKE